MLSLSVRGRAVRKFGSGYAGLPAAGDTQPRVRVGWGDQPADLTSWTLDPETNQFLAQPIVGDAQEGVMGTIYAKPDALVTTGWVAETLGRKWLSIELSADYVAGSQLRGMQP